MLHAVWHFVPEKQARKLVSAVYPPEQSAWLNEFCAILKRLA